MGDTNTLHITVMGGLQMRLGEDKPIRFVARRAAILIAYLAMTGGTHSREALATMLWDDRTQKQSMANMRSLLALIPKQIKPYIIKSRNSLAMNEALPFTVDALAFATAFKQGAFAEAVQWYTGEFLAGVAVSDSEGLELWLLTTRERLHQQAIEAHQALAEACLHQQRFTQGVAHADTLVALEPLREGSYQMLMTLLARDGQRGRALQVYRQCRAMLAEEFGLEPMARTMGLAQRIRQMKDEPPFVVPLPAGACIGRETELKIILDKLDPAGNKLITLTGPGGIGKTHLALAIAHHLRHNFWDGIYFIELAGLANDVATEETLASYIASKIDLVLQRTTSAKDQLIDHLAQREILLILDNMEHLLPAGINLIQALQQTAPYLNLLITSRQRLNLPTEHIIALRGLSISQQTDTLIQLFQQAAQRTQATFQVTSEQDRTSALAICRLVEGSPLGIKLATAWLAYYPLPHIHQALTDNLDFITTRQQNIPVRHRSLRAVFQHSWNLLTPDEQTTLAQLTIFRGGFDLEAARAIATIPARLILNLVDKSLVRAEGHDTPRFVLHDLVQQYALEKQDPAGAHTLQQKHATYYLTLIAQPTPSQQIELGNIQSAWQWTINHQPLTLLTYLGNLTRFYEMAGFFQEAGNNLQQAIERVNQLPQNTATDLLVQLHLHQAEFYAKQGPYPAGIQSAQTAYQLATNPDDKISARLQLSRITGLQGQQDIALTYAEECQTYYEKTNNLPGLATTLDFIGHIYTRQGNIDQALIALQQAVTIGRQLSRSRQLNDEQRLIGQLIHLGTVYMELAEYDKAQRHHQEARQLAQQHNYQERLAQTANNIGLVHWRQGKYQAALTSYQEAKQIAYKVGHLRGQALTLSNMGIIYKEMGEFEKALNTYQESLVISENAGLRWEIAINMGNIGNLYKQQGDYDSALPYLHQALAVDKALANKDGMARHLGNIGDIYRQRQEYTKALPYFDQSIALSASGSDYYLCSYLILKALTLYELGHIDEASVLNAKGLALAKKVKYGSYITKGSALAQKLAALAQQTPTV